MLRHLRWASENSGELHVPGTSRQEGSGEDGDRELQENLRGLPHEVHVKAAWFQRDLDVIQGCMHLEDERECALGRQTVGTHRGGEPGAAQAIALDGSGRVSVHGPNLSPPSNRRFMRTILWRMQHQKKK